MLTLSELQADITELQAVVKSHENWTKRDDCITCGAGVYRSNGSSGMRHRQMLCGDQERRLLAEREREMESRLLRRQHSRWEN
jgi:hypothetical protein